MTEQTASQAGYAAHRGVSRKTVTIWKQKGLLVFTDGGEVDVVASDQLLLDQGGKRAAVTAGNAAPKAASKDRAAEEAADQLLSVEGRTFFSKAQAERMKENYLARLRQIEFDKAAGAVVETEDVVEAVIAEYAIVRNKLLAIGARIAPRAAVMRTAGEVKALVDREIALALEELTLDADGDADADDIRRSLRRKTRRAA